ncbi:MAG: isoprenylcysteine carboxylmethyltransferase family protein [Candidatus Helarchaeota archaeon]|nr:isoprenylcysteine carboxylmethyltransferase family protein [Candidatus Helarchaeota archaeon]
MNKEIEIKGGLNKNGYKYIASIIIVFFIQGAIFFIAAWRIDIPLAWIFFGINFVYTVVSLIIQAKFNPELVNARGEAKEAIKTWDKILMPTFIIMCGVIFGVIGLDVGRFQWSNLGIYYIYFMVAGYVLYAIFGILINWAMLENEYFEESVRIQEDRGHQVVSTGPYKIVRHPGYLATILWAIAVPFILGSFYGLIPAGISIIILVIRTSLEDKTLHEELDGYSEYAKKTKYRLFPLIW